MQHKPYCKKITICKVIVFGDFIFKKNNTIKSVMKNKIDIYKIIAFNILSLTIKKLYYSQL